MRCKTPFRSSFNPRPLALLIITSFSTSAFAVSKSWSPAGIGTSFNWADAANWSPAGVPNTADTVDIEVGGTSSQTIVYNDTRSNVTLSSLIINHNNPLIVVNANEFLSIPAGVLMVDNILVADSSVRALAEIDQSGGEVLANLQLSLGINPGNNGIYNFAGSFLSVPLFRVAVGGGALFNCSGGGNASTLIIADQAGSNGTFNLTNSLTLNLALGSANDHVAFIGNNGSGVLNLLGGSLSTSQAFIGVGAGSSGTVTLTGGDFESIGTLTIGVSGAGTFNQSAGTVSAAPVVLGANPGSSAAYNLSGGTFFPHTLTIGSGGSATFTQTGGTCAADVVHLGESASGAFLLSGNASLEVTTLIVGDFHAASFTQSGGFLSGQLTVGASSTGTFLLNGSSALLDTTSVLIGNTAPGTLTQTAGFHVVAGGMSLSKASSGSAYLLSGGTLQVGGGEGVGVEAAATFVQTGGTNTLFGDSPLIIGDTNPQAGLCTYFLSGGLLNAIDIFIAGSSLPTGQGLLSVTGTSSLTMTSSLTIFTKGIATLGNSQPLFDIPAVNLQGGSLVLSGPTKSLRTSSLIFAGTANAWSGKRNLTANTLILQTTTANKSSTIPLLINQLNTAAIFSTLSANQTLAFVDNNDLNLTSYRGATGLDQNSLIITNALLGDADLSGTVDAADFDRWFKNVGVFSFSFAIGDFNRSGIIDAADFDLWFSHVGLIASPLSSVPEPTSLLLLSLPVALARRIRHAAQRSYQDYLP
jgi:hypothetical protein